MKEFYYTTETGFDVCVDICNTLKEAIEIAALDDNIDEIWKYEKEPNGDMGDVVECVWVREGFK